MLVNQIIISKIKNLIEVANKSNLKSKFVYKKIIDELVNLETPIVSLTQIRNIPNIGIKTADLLFKHVEMELTKKITNLEELEKYKLFFSYENYIEIKNKLHKYKEENEIKEDFFNSDIDTNSIEIKRLSLSQPVVSENIQKVATKKRSKKSKNYIPGYKTGPYAILKALWLEDGISKHKIIQIAKNYCNTDFDLTSRNSAWSGMKTLISKNLVYKESGSKKFYITLEGQIIANKLFKDTSIIQPNNTNITLLIDSREIKNRNHRSFFQSYFDNTNVCYETRLLEVGDFAWIDNEMICNFIVERKCGSDFVSSIVDGRFKEQKNRLLDTGILNIFYIVENLKISDFKNITSECGFYSLTSTKLQNFVVLETEDIKESASVIEMIHNRVKDTKKDFKMSYGSFIEKGNKNKNLNINNLLFYSFAAIYGINNEKASKLASHFKTFYNFYTLESKNELRSELLDKKFELSKKNVEDIIHFMCSTTKYN